MARTPLYKHLIRLVFIFLFLLLLGFGALVLWVVTGPRSLAVLTPYIESALSSPTGAYKVKIQNSMLIWDGWTHPVGIRAENVDMTDNKGGTVAHFPEVGVRLYFFELIRGTVDLKSIELLGPVVKLVQDAQGNITSFGFSNDNKGPNNSMSDALTLFTSEQEDNPIKHLKSFIIQHASLSVEDSHGDPFLNSPDSSIEIIRKHTMAEGSLKMPLQFDGKASEIRTKFVIDGSNHTVTSEIIFTDVPSAILHALAPTQKWIDGIRVPLTGWANVASDFNADISSIDFTLEAGEGTIEFPDQFEQALPIQHIKLAGTLTDRLATFTVKDSELKIAGHTLAFHGIMHKQGEDYGLTGYAETEGLPVDDIHSYWPLKLAPKSRKWVIAHLSKGKVVKANVALDFKPGEFKLKDTPETAVDSTITLRGATINYKPTHPAVTDINAVVRFTGKIMDAKISSANYMDNTHVSSGRVRFPDFYPDDVRLFLDLDVDSGAKDVQRFLALPDLNKAEKLGLTKDITGQASGNAKFDFIAFSDNSKDDVGETGKINYAINADLKDVTQKRFLGKRDIAGAFMKLSVDNKQIKLSGKARVNEVPMDINLRSDFGRNNETVYDIKTEMPVARLPDFGLPQMDFATGNMGVNAKFLSSDDADHAEVALDLTHTAISLPAQGLLKKAGVRATLDLSTEAQPSGNTLIKSFALKGDGYDVGGTAEYDKGLNDFGHFNLNPARFAGTDLDSLEYEKRGNIVRLSAKGRVFDVSPYFTDTSKKRSDLDYMIGLNVSRLILGAGRELGDVRVEADCPADACRMARITAKLRDDTPFTYTIADGKLAASCDNAGELARTLNILSSIGGGKMTLQGQYDAGTLNGVMEVKEYRIKNAPIMTKIFTIASLSGILNTLTGNGIYFERLSAPFQYHRGTIILKDTKAHGAALGLTADGIIDTNKSTLDLKGLLVPSYTLNSLVGNVPLIGDLLMGGSGKGLVALSYSVHGDMGDPSIRVNPLSVLTPGFLRDIFNIFDKPPPDMDAIEAAQKKAQATKVAVPLAPAPAVTIVPVSPPAAATPPAAPAAPQDPALPSLDELQK